MDKETAIAYLAQVMAGLAVPYSISPSVLGAAGNSWLMLHQAVGFGWKSKEEYQAWLTEVLA